MKSSILITIILSGLPVGAFSQSAPDPPELTHLREGWERTRRQVTAPIDKRYLDALQGLKLRFTKEGKLNEALAIDGEIKKLEGSSGEVPVAVSNKLQILSAFYGEVGGTRRIETTEVIRGAINNREDGIRLNTKFGAGGKDPAPSVAKETTITYSIRGEIKTRTFAENHDLKFKEDLK